MCTAAGVSIERFPLLKKMYITDTVLLLHIKVWVLNSKSVKPEKEKLFKNFFLFFHILCLSDK